MKFNFNKMTKGEIAFRLDEAVRSLNAETPEFYDLWLANYDDDDATVKDAKATWDDVSDEDDLWEGLLEAFRYMIDMYGCEEGRSLAHSCHEGLWYENFKGCEYEEDEVGGGFFIMKNGDQDEKASSRLARVRETLSLAGYPLTDTKSEKRGYYFEVDWKKIRAMKAAQWIKDSIEWLKAVECGCCTVRFTRNTQLAIGWTNGYDPEEPSVIHSKENPSWVISLEVKALEGDDMKTDLDWLTSPYIAGGENEGTIFDLSVTPLEDGDYERDFRYLVSAYRNILKSYTVLSDGKAYKRK